MNREEILERLRNGEISIDGAKKMLDELAGNNNDLGKNVNTFVSSVMNEVNSKINNAFTSRNKDDFDEKDGWAAIIKLAPFASAKSLDKLVKSQLAKNDNIDWKKVIELAPFISDEALKDIAVHALSKSNPDFDIIVKLAPFIESETLEELIDECHDRLNLKLIIRLAPFLDEEYIDKLIEKLADY